MADVLANVRHRSVRPAIVWRRPETVAVLRPAEDRVFRLVFRADPYQRCGLRVCHSSAPLFYKQLVQRLPGHLMTIAIVRFRQ